MRVPSPTRPATNRTCLSLAALISALASAGNVEGQTLPRPPEVHTVDASYSGSLCSPGSYTIQTGPGITVVGASSFDPSAPTNGSCDVTVDISIPKGFSVSNAQLCYGYFVNGIAGEGEQWSTPPAEFSLRYGYAGSELPHSFTSTLTNDIINECVTLTSWSPCSGGDTEQFKLHLALSAPQGLEALWRNFYVTFPSTPDSWRTCAGDTASFPRSRLMEDCSSATGAPCEEGLVCSERVTFQDVTVEICKDPNVAPIPAGEPCEWGHECADRLVCAFVEGETGSSQQVCMTSDEFASDCRESNNCPAGTVCFNSDCIVPGLLASPCNEQLPCNAGLYCNTELGSCRYREVREGEACGDDIAICNPQFTCDPASGTCRASRGEYRDYCDGSAATCNEGLQCILRKCVHTNQEPGATCIFGEECVSRSCYDTVCE